MGKLRLNQNQTPAERQQPQTSPSDRSPVKQTYPAGNRSALQLQGAIGNQALNCLIEAQREGGESGATQSSHLLDGTSPLNQPPIQEGRERQLQQTKGVGSTLADSSILNLQGERSESTKPIFRGLSHELLATQLSSRVVQQSSDHLYQAQEPKGYESTLSDFSLLNLQGERSIPMQPKQALGVPGDKYEQKADRVAAQVVQQSTNNIKPSSSQVATASPALEAPIQRAKDFKTTENRIIEEAKREGGLTEKHTQQLMHKMQKRQTKERARKIAAPIEAETAELVSSVKQSPLEELPIEPNLEKERSLKPMEELLKWLSLDNLQKDQNFVTEGIKNYVLSSLVIQTNARRENLNSRDDIVDILEALKEARKTGSKISQNKQARIPVHILDAALRAIGSKIAEDRKARITYRSITYESVADIPYGKDVNGNTITIGDTVKDTGFLSTSEHRQFILGKTQNETPTALLKLAIYGSSGVPIALDFNMAYSNRRAKELWEREPMWKKVVSSPGAGQAEVLYPRNKLFTVKSIKRGENEVSVVLEEQQGDKVPGLVKNMKDGTPFSQSS